MQPDRSRGADVVALAPPRPATEHLVVGGQGNDQPGVTKENSQDDTPGNSSIYNYLHFKIPDWPIPYCGTTAPYCVSLGHPPMLGAALSTT